jgi:biotin carboxylase
VPDPPRILFLGASPQQLAPLVVARRRGWHVITCDNRPDNPGHMLAHESYGVSTIDREGILQVAREARVDAVITYGSDVAAPTAAFVCEKLGLAGNPTETVQTLANKGHFRRFQAANGIFCPAFRLFRSADLPDDANAGVDIAPLELPVIVKPVDASGGRGVTKVRLPGELAPALRHALSQSISGEAIVEVLVTPVGYQVCGEGFIVDGRIAFHCFANEHFGRFVVPVGESFPSVFTPAQVQAGVAALQEVFTLLGMRQGPFNFDLMFTAGGVFVIEIGPRNGGNRMPEAILHATGIDTIEATLEAALGRPVSFPPHATRFRATYSIHSEEEGVLQAVRFLGDFERHVVDAAMFRAPGSPVKPFTTGSHMIGCLILAFDDYAEMLEALDHMERHIAVDVL